MMDKIEKKKKGVIFGYGSREIRVLHGGKTWQPATDRLAAGSWEMGDIFNCKHEAQRVNQKKDRALSPPENLYHFPKQCYQLGTRWSNAWAYGRGATSNHWRKKTAGQSADPSTRYTWVLPSGGWLWGFWPHHFWQVSLLARIIPKTDMNQSLAGTTVAFLTKDRYQNCLFSKSLSAWPFLSPHSLLLSS